MGFEGYPQGVIIMVLGGGFALAFFRPYAAFLLALFLLTSGHVTMFNQTRLAGLGPYLNLTDACLLVALVAFFFDCIAGKRPVRIPQIVAMMLFVVVIAVAQTAWKLGWTYDTLRTARWAVQFPVAVFLGANMVTSAGRAKKLIAALFAAALLAALQHVVFAANIWRTQALSMENYVLMRTIGYWGGCLAPAFLLTALVWRRGAALWNAVLWTVAGLLFLATIVMNQTRSVWLAMVASVPCVLFVFRTKNQMQRVAKLGLVLGLLLVAAGGLIQRAMPGLDLLAIGTERIVRIFEEGETYSQTVSRERALRVEMASWAEGSLFFGRGLCYFQTFEHSDDPDKRIAFGHLGYVTYLSQLGLVGLAVYGLCVPLHVVRFSRYVWFHADTHVVQYLGLLGVASVVCLSVMFAMSSQLLTLGYFAPGVLYGSVETLAVRCVGSNLRREMGSGSRSCD